MKRIFSVVFSTMFLLSSICVAQNTSTLSGTVTDSGSQTWNYAIWTAILVIPGGGNKAVYLDGTPVTTSASGVLSSAGAFSGSVGNTANIQPSGTRWKFMLCPMASSPCQNPASTFAVTGTTYNVGTPLSALIIAPSIQAAQLVYAYSATEITNSTNGDGYLNTVSGATFYWQNGTYVQTTAPAVTPSQIQTALKTGTNCNMDNTYFYAPFSGNCFQGGAIWNTIASPTGNQALNMGAYTSTFTYGAATGSGNLFNFIDTANNTGTGYFWSISNSSGSGLRALRLYDNVGLQNFFSFGRNNGHSPEYDFDLADVSGSSAFTHRYNNVAQMRMVENCQFCGGEKTFLAVNLDIEGKINWVSYSRAVDAGAIGHRWTNTVTQTCDTGVIMHQWDNNGTVMQRNYPCEAVSSIGQAFPIRSVTSTGSTTTSDFTVLVNGTFTYNVVIDSTVHTGHIFAFKNTGTGTVTISSTVNIDASSTYSLSSQNQFVVLQYDGSQLRVIGASSSGGAPVDVSGTAVVGTPHQNTNAYAIQASGALITSGSGVGNVACEVGTTSSPTLPVWENQATATVISGSAGFVCRIPAGYWYNILASGNVTSTIQSWYETP